MFRPFPQLDCPKFSDGVGAATTVANPPHINMLAPKAPPATYKNRRRLIRLFCIVLHLSAMTECVVAVIRTSDGPGDDTTSASSCRWDKM
jgi:hypothetical protein